MTQRMWNRALARGFVASVALSIGACGGGSGGGGPASPPPTATLSVFAGDMGGEGTVDGTGAGARFGGAQGVVVDTNGDAIVADTANNTIRRVTPAGVVTLIAGAPGVAGTQDGPALSARFFHPSGLAIDAGGNLYVADTSSHTIRRISSGGDVTTVAGAAGVAGSADGAGGDARFSRPYGVAVDPAGNLFVTDSVNQTIRRITPAGVVTTLAGTAGAAGSADGVAAAARFRSPTSLAREASGTLVVCDEGNATIRRVAPDGTVTTIAGTALAYGSADGLGAAARFEAPAGIAVEGSVIHVVDYFGQTLRRIDASGAVTTVAGAVGQGAELDGTGAAARFMYPAAVAVAPGGVLLVADYAGKTLRRVAAGAQVSTLAGMPARPGSTDGRGTAARFDNPGGIAADAGGNLYVADSFNNTIRRVTPAGEVVTLAGLAGSAGTTDGVGAAARFDEPIALAVDAIGNVYVADTFNHTVRRITPAGVVSTIAGLAGSAGSTNGIGTAARFSSPSGIAVDGVGNVYVAELGNHTIRRISSAGEVTTLAGVPGVSGSADGTGGGATFFGPWGAAVDNAGNVYVADLGNSTIRRITPAGLVTTLAGRAGFRGSADGAGAAARFNAPRNLAVDANGDLYVADALSLIRKVSASGVVTTIAGVGGERGFVPGALPGRVSPRGVALSGTSLYATMFNGVAVIRDRP